MPYISPQFKQGYELMHEGTVVLSEIEQTGMCIDVEYCKSQQAHLSRKIDRLERLLHEDSIVKEWKSIYRGDFNLNSNAQLSDILFKRMQIPHPLASDENPNPTTVDKATLAALDVPIIKNMLQMRKLKKAKDTYISNLISESVDGILHPSFGLHNVRSFRSSSSGPNFQNIPIRDPEIKKAVRRAFIPRPGHVFGGVDFGSMEVRIAACVVGSTELRTIDGHQTITHIIERVNNNEDVFVYGYDSDKKRVALSRVTAGGMTRKNAEVWKVVLDNGKEIIATPDHNFMLRDGVYVPLKELKQGDSLMPFYEKVISPKASNGAKYRQIYLNNGQSILEHNLIAEDIKGTIIKGSGLLVHHKNSNGCCNKLSNLEIMDRAEHMRIHSIQGWERTRDTRNNLFRDKEFQKQQGLRLKKWRENLSTEEKFEYGRRISDSVKARGGMIGTNNPMYGKHHTIETKEKLRITKTGTKLGPSWSAGLTKENHPSLAKLSNSRKGQPTWNKGKKGLYITSKETKKKISISSMGRVFTDETKKLLSQNKIKHWEHLRESGEKVQCAICGNVYTVITNTHLRNKHNITCEEYKETYNHKVVSVEFAGYEDVFNINVDRLHNYAVSSGVILKNCYHKDPKMLEYLTDPTTDMHRDVAMDCFMISDPQKVHKAIRQEAKGSFTFAQFYGDYYVHCAKNLWAPVIRDNNPLTLADGQTKLIDHLRACGIDDYGDFEKHMQKVEDIFWNQRFSVYTQWKKDWKSEYDKKGYFDLYTGFRCSGFMKKNDVLNYQIQGSAFHCLLWSLIQLHKWLKTNKLRTVIVGQIHDEAVLDMHESEIEVVLAKCKEIMTVDIVKHWSWIIAPLEVEADFCPPNGTWYEKTGLPVPQKSFVDLWEQYKNGYVSEYSKCL